MPIDWFTVGAQAVNFVILVWLLKHFLYRPVLDAIDAREARIAAQIADAVAKEQRAEADGEVFRKKNEVFDAERAALLATATEAAQVERKRLVDAARQAADDLAARRDQALRDDATHLNRTLVDRTRREVFEIARKALADLATATLEASMTEIFATRIRVLDGPAKASLTAALAALAANDKPAIVRSAFELPEAERTAIRSALVETFGGPAADAIRLTYEIAPDVVSGVELVAGGQKVAWTIAQYLASLEHAVGEVLSTGDKGAPAAPPEADAKPAKTPE